MSTSWERARAVAARACGPVPGHRVPLVEAAGAVLAEDAVALTDLPPADVSAMDGWAVAGEGPWRVRGEVLAGAVPVPLAPGDAVRIATGARLPVGAQAVLRSERALVIDATVRVARPVDHEPAPAAPPPGTDVRRAGRECRRGDVVLEAGARLTPAAVALLAAAGHDDAPVRVPRVTVLVLGDELLDAGTAREGRVRDALGPLLATWLPALGLRVAVRRRVADRADDLDAALDAADGDLVVTTGSTARGPVDHLHGVLAARGARLLVDGVAVRPGHPQLLATLPGGRPLVGLPGNPLAAVSALFTLVEPVADALSGARPRPGRRVRLAVDVPAGTDATRLVPVRAGAPVLYAGPAMLRGIATADAVAVVPPGGLPAGAEALALSLPWAG